MIFSKFVLYGSDSILKPQLTVEFESAKTNLSKMTLSIKFLRRSSLFQIQVGWILR